MPDILIRDISSSTLQSLKQQAAREGRSLQQQLRALLERAAIQRAPNPAEAAERIRRRLAESGLKYPDSTTLVRKDRER